MTQYKVVYTMPTNPEEQIYDRFQDYEAARRAYLRIIDARKVKTVTLQKIEVTETVLIAISHEV